MQIQGIIERKGKKYVTYTFNNPNAFYEVSYKSMRANQNIDFIRCNYMRHNGNIRLLYHIENYCTLATAVASMSPNAFASLLINILDAVLEIKSSGFINIETVDLEPKNIYIDMEELKPYFIYVPVNVQSTSEHYYGVMEYLKKSIVYMIQTNLNLQSDLTSSISREIMNQCNSIESLKSSISNMLGIYQGNGSNSYREILYADKQVEEGFDLNSVKEVEKEEKKKLWFMRDKKKEEVEFAETSVLIEEFVPQIALVSTNQQPRLEFIVNKKEFVIGHKPEFSDACISSHASISRRHCKIYNQNGKNYVVDLSSTNGTFVNGKRINSNQEIEITPGDRIKVSEVEFLVTNMSNAGRA